MKSFLFSLLSLLLISNFSNAQNYAWAFPDSGMIWCQYEGGGDGVSAGYTDYKEIISTGEKVFKNGRWYTKLLETGKYTGGRFGMQNTSTYKDVEFGMFWNDTLNKSVDCYTPNGRFIYDFDMEVGDTVKWVSYSSPVIVSSIDSITIAGKLRKIYGFLGTYLIDGVGPANGLGTCGGNPLFVDLGCGGELNCFKIGSSVYSQDRGAIDSTSDCSSCDYYVRPVGVNELENELFISVYPNPADSKVFIEQKREIKNAQIEVRDMAGKVVESFKLSEQLVEINTQDWVSGTYFLSLKSKNKFYTKKLVVMH